MRQHYDAAGFERSQGSFTRPGGRAPDVEIGRSSFKKSLFMDLANYLLIYFSSLHYMILICCRQMKVHVHALHCLYSPGSKEDIAGTGEAHIKV
jgi:hypothetical protein